MPLRAFVIPVDCCVFPRKSLCRPKHQQRRLAKLINTTTTILHYTILHYTILHYTTSHIFPSTHLTTHPRPTRTDLTMALFKRNKDKGKRLADGSGDERPVDKPKRKRPASTFTFTFTSAYTPRSPSLLPHVLYPYHPVILGRLPSTFILDSR